MRRRWSGVRGRRWTWVGVTALAVAAVGVAVALNLPARLPQAPSPLPAASAATARVSGTSLAKGEETASPGPAGSTASTTAGASLANQATPPLDTVFFLNDQMGWAAGRGVILGTTDGGTNWEKQYAGTATIRQVDFVDATHGWALTLTGLLATQNGGQSWSAVSGSAPAFTQIEFVSDTQGWGVGASGLEFTTDGGTHWQPAATPAPVQSVCFTSPQTGWAAGGTTGASTVLRTTDGGSRWQVAYHVPVIVPPGAVPSRFSAQVRCTGGSTAWVLVAVDALQAFQQPYAVFFTDNGGRSWSEPFAEPQSAGVLFPSAPRTIGGAAGAFAAVGAGSARFVGLCPSCGTAQPLSGGVVLTAAANGGQNVRQQVLYGISAPPSTGIVPATPALAFPGAEHGWVATTDSGAGGRIYATADGGRSWTQQYPPAGPQPLASISFVTSQQGYGLGTLGDPEAVLQTSDGGSRWSVVGQLPTAAINPLVPAVPPGPSLGLSFTSVSSGWAVNGSALERTADGGRTWTAEALPTAAGQSASVPQLDGVAFLPGGETGCVLESVGGSLSYLGTTDGGRNWAAVALPQPALSSSGHALPGTGGAQGALACALQESGKWSAALQSIVSSGLRPVILAAVGPSALWTTVPGEAGLHLNATADSGATWVTYTLAAHSSIQSVSFATVDDGWLLTAGGRLLRSVDGGASWTPT